MNFGRIAKISGIVVINKPISQLCEMLAHFQKLFAFLLQFFFCARHFLSAKSTCCSQFFNNLEPGKPSSRNMNSAPCSFPNLKPTFLILHKSTPPPPPPPPIPPSTLIYKGRPKLEIPSWRASSRHRPSMKPPSALKALDFFRR